MSQIEPVLLFQGIGFIALALGLISVQWKHRQHILLTQLLASVFWVIHFALVGAASGAAMNAVGALRTFIVYRLGEGNNRPRLVLWMLLFLVLIVGLVIWQNWLSALPLLAMLLATIAFWQRDEQRIRWLLLAVAPIWFVYNFMYGSWAGMASDTLAVISISIALWRHRSS